MAWRLSAVACGQEGKPRRARHPLAPLFWYGAVASFNAVFYFLLASFLVMVRTPPSLAAVAALVPVLAISYLGHKAKTFQSTAAHRREAPRFFVLSVVDLTLAALAPAFANRLGIAPAFAFAALTGIIPFANFLIMRFWVFR